MAVWDTITSRATNITGSEGVKIFARDEGGIANYTLDAVLEESLEMSVETPSYPIESGATKPRSPQKTSCFSFSRRGI